MTMRTAEQWMQEFGNRWVLNVKGQEVTEFIRRIQEDALARRNPPLTSTFLNGKKSFDALSIADGRIAP
jgi:hypothetical protein